MDQHPMTRLSGEPSLFSLAKSAVNTSAQSHVLCNMFCRCAPCLTRSLTHLIRQCGQDIRNTNKHLRDVTAHTVHTVTSRKFCLQCTRRTITYVAKRVLLPVSPFPHYVQWFYTRTLQPACCCNSIRINYSLNFQIVQNFKIEYKYGKLEYKVQPMYLPEGPLSFTFTDRSSYYLQKYN